jgi:hypothetical protein
VITKNQANKALNELDTWSLYYQKISQKNQAKYLKALGDLKEIFLTEA